MTKSELLEALRDVPDDAEVSIGGGNLEVCVYEEGANRVTLDHDTGPFEEGDGLKPCYRNILPERVA